MRPLAFVDVETTGLYPSRHEIIELGVVVADPRTLETRGMFDVRVRPGRRGSRPRRGRNLAR